MHLRVLFDSHPVFVIVFFDETVEENIVITPCFQQPNLEHGEDAHGCGKGTVEGRGKTILYSILLIYYIKAQSKAEVRPYLGVCFREGEKRCQGGESRERGEREGLLCMRVCVCTVCARVSLSLSFFLSLSLSRARSLSLCVCGREEGVETGLVKEGRCVKEGQRGRATQLRVRCS